jgi:8-oxo-dGTP pyrophosphatase MutT (NUDIX family)
MSSVSERKPGGLRDRRMVAALPVLLRAGQHLIGLVTSSTGRWIVPKGKRKRRERSHACAEREAREEAGVAGRARGRPVAFMRSASNGPAGVPVYVLEVRQVLDIWPERHVRRRAWHTPRRAAALVDDPDLAAAIRQLFLKAA